MKNTIALLALLTLSFVGKSQSNDCSTATNLPITGNCSTPLAGTTTGATQSIAGCSGTADDDVWYQFTATSTTHQITVVPSAGMDPVVQAFSGACSTLISIQCKDLGFTGETEIVNLNGLTIGTTYRIRVYHYGAGSGTGSFTICNTTGPSVPSNNNCSSATMLTVNPTCVTTSGTTFGATQSLTGCAGNADDDVWYAFVATNSTQTVTVSPTSSNFDPVFQVYSGNCSTLSSELCVDNTFSNQTETSDIVGLVAGQTYYIRVYDYYNANNGTFTICVTGPATATPTNDEPCNAIQLPAVTSDCNYMEFTTVGATTTTIPGAPSSCIGGSGAMIGGYTSGTKDVWFKITVPSSGKLFITPKPNMGTGRISDGVMALYSGTCGSLTQISCSDDNNFPGSANDLLPFISASGLTPGSTVFLRFFGFGTSQGSFGICVTTTLNDNCANALYICDINGYSASTSAAYTPDRPCNMRGNAETNNPPTYTYTPGIDQGGIFGAAGPWGTGSPSPDVRIDNNSWIRFTAAATTAVLNVSVYDCWVGNYPSGGIQMQLFASNGSCCNFTPVSNFEENSNAFTITGTGLTIGNDYYLMVDGYAGDICNYTISAQSGVQFPEITPVAPICSGSSVVLTAPAGATSYLWEHNGATTQSVSVSPGTTQNFSVEVSGLCGYKQTLTTTVTVNPVPAAPMVTSALSVCQNATLNLTASTVSGATYSWTGPNGFSSNLQNPSISNVNSVHAGVYTVTITVNGCTSPSATTTVTVNPIPAAPVASSNSPVCVGQTILLTASAIPNATYTWSGPSSFSSTIQNPSRANAIAGYAGIYSVIATVNGCSSTSSATNIVVNPIPSAPTVSSNSPICAGNSINLSATTIPNASYAWTGPNSFSSTQQNPTIGSSTTAMSGSYQVSAIVNGCSSSPTSVVVTVHPIPATPTPTNSGPICSGSGVTFNAALAANTTYSWSGPNGFSSTQQNPTLAAATTIHAGNYSLIITTNGCSSAPGQTSLVVNSPALVDAGSNLASCNGSTVNLGGSFAGSASSVTWSGGGGTFGSITNPSTSYTPSAGEIASGSVVLIITTNDPAGPCPAVNDQLTISISSNPSAAFSYPNTPYCQSNADPSPVYPIGSSGGSFSSTAGLSINGTTGQIDLSSSAPGNYVVTNFIAANGSCPSASATTSIEIVATPSTPIANNNGLICENGTINLSTPTVIGATYNWSGPNGFSSTQQNPSINNVSLSNTGNYQVSVTVNGCPSLAGSTNVVISSNPTVGIANGTTASVCIGENITLIANGANSYLWSTTETTSSISVTPNSSTLYTVTGTTNGCSSQATINITTNPLPSMNSTPTSGNSRCDLPTGSLTNVILSGTPSFTYTWYDNTGNAVGVNQDLINIPAGTYSLEVMDGNGCTNQFGPFTVSNFPPPVSPTVTFTTTQPCENGSIEGSASTISGATYTWSGPNGFSSNSQNFTIDPINLNFTGNYCATVIVNGCPSPPACQIVTVNSLPMVTVQATNNDTMGCIGQDLTLTATGGTTYSWTGPTGFVSNQNPVTLALTNTNQSGYYYVTGTNGMNCSASDSILITANPLPTTTFTSNVVTSNAICSGDTVQIQVSGGVFYTWNGPNNFTSFNNVIHFTPILAINTGNYTVQVTDLNGCSTSDTIALSITPDQFGSINGATSLCPKATLVLTASGGGTYSWSGPNQFVSSNETITIPSFTAGQQGTYSVLVTDTNGCTSLNSTEVSISYSAACLDIPELVSPNGDGHNDTWQIDGLDNFLNAKVMIFNRWGNLIYEVTPYSTPWNGEPNTGFEIDGSGGKVPVGTYFYVIELNDQEKNVYKGYLELQY